jgi:N12 class adenine-specific DNA methylase
MDLFDLIPTAVPTSAPRVKLSNTVIEGQLLEHITERRLPRQFITDNLEALRLLQLLDAQSPRSYNSLSDEERKVLLRFHGWGAMPDVFLDEPPSALRESAGLIRELIVGVAGELGYQQARGTILTAFYTPPVLMGVMYRILERLGVKGGRWLEPSCGTGLFLGAAPAQWRVEWTGVEIDAVSAKIAQWLYPVSDIQVGALEQADLPIDYFDAVVGNVPFTEVAPYDRQFSGWEFGGLHDYCIAKAVRCLKPGGVAALITSVGSLQSKRSQGFRERLAQQCKLVAAIKLPRDSFRSFAGTQISADLLILRKLLPRQGGNSSQWVNLVDSPIRHPETGVALNANCWFIENPQWVLGEWAIDKHYASPRLDVVRAKDAVPIEDEITALVGQLPEQDELEPEADVPAKEKGKRSTGDSRQLPTEMREDPDLRIGQRSFVLLDGVVWQYDYGRLYKVKETGTRSRRMWNLCRIKESLHRVLGLQRRGCTDEELKRAQKQLNTRYDQFVRDYGYLHEMGNAIAFNDDPDFPLMLSIEIWDKDRPERVEKAAIFTERTITHTQPRQEPQSAKEALVDCLSDRGYVDLEYMASRYRPVAQILKELQDTPESALLFHDPQLEKWVTRDEYLSGNVKVKLNQAIAASEFSDRYRINIQALDAVQPKDLQANQIYVQLGSAWLGEGGRSPVIAAFASELLGVGVDKIRVHHNERSNEWDVVCSGNIAPAQAVKFGTNRINPLRLLDLALNQQSAVIYDDVYDAQRKDYKQVKNHAETRRALQKQQLIKQEFKRWIWRDSERTEALVERYNRQFNAVKPRKWDGAHLQYNLDGVSAHWKQKLTDPNYRHQLDTVWRVLCNGNTLGQIPVGGGKTAIMVVASQLLRQFGKCDKPMIVVPNHLVLQQAAEALQIYPGLRVLMIASELMPTVQRRRETISRCATENWDLIICSQTALTSIPLHPETVVRYQAEETKRLMGAWEQGRVPKASSKKDLKDRERQTERLENKVLYRHQQIARSSVAYFNDMGVDWLFVDESQEYLGLPTDTRITGVLGLGTSSSQKAIDLRLKAQYLAEMKGEGKGLVLMSGTPIRNTLGQAWVNLVYLMPHVLEDMRLLGFDSFVSVFAESVTQTEVTPAGTLDLKTRLATWSNLPELKNIWRQVAHIIHDKDLKIKRPVATYRTVEVEATPLQLKFFSWLADRTRDFKKSGKPKAGEDNWCAVCSDTAQGVIDLRLLPSYKLMKFLNEEEIGQLDRERSKLEQLIDKVYESWSNPLHAQEKRVQLIFCDLGTPKPGGRWTAYSHMKASWIKRGVVEGEIAFIHDAKTDEQKAELFKQVRLGKKRILVASTSKLGVGTQIPDRLYEERQLSCPVRPADIRQRIGRILRPGNRHSEVEISFYVTTGKPIEVKDKEGKETVIQGISPDSWLWGVVQRKDTAIEGIFSEDDSVRTQEDIDEVALDFATLQATATGDRRLIEKMNLDREVLMLLETESDWQSQRSMAEGSLKRLPGWIADDELRLKGLQEDLTQALALEDQPFSMEWGKKVITDRKDAAKKVWTWLLTTAGSNGNEELGTLGGFTIVGSRTSWGVEVLLKRHGTYRIEAPSTARGTFDRVMRVAEGIENAIALKQQEINAQKRRLEAAEAIVRLPFAEAGQLEQLMKRQADLAKQLGLLESAVA